MNTLGTAVAAEKKEARGKKEGEKDEAEDGESEVDHVVGAIVGIAVSQDMTMKGLQATLHVRSNDRLEGKGNHALTAGGEVMEIEDLPVERDNRSHCVEREKILRSAALSILNKKDNGIHNSERLEKKNSEYCLGASRERAFAEKPMCG